ncbi:hypothetical protein SPRG_22231 [Saprolegnia parasitica CBS 223.65]|uniref:Uncharacterized protein n=1 Tax=Saprolegnia parasitica (strain CBS 223.65) TaxID=695850 RepID=A0A067CG75_SAPPC|nr:hypothetical protein SPRG_22231 [Saprolegnia parasitica CBS 223.65]KDO25561.1 hypothetical protein SPRG_22231 [Saprolegnia parasitica CBS 223.65]|eukprot:XP_012203798.1 hypothetical protein SPRG_22231 [Saprolegnia parasitica CBS 223.65]
MLTIDCVGTAAALTLPKSDDLTFGTKAHVLASDAVGGAVTVSYRDHTTQWDSVDDHVVAYYSEACSLDVAPIVSGTRAAVLYTVDHSTVQSKGDEDVLYRQYSKPIPPPTIARMQDAVAEWSEHTHVALCWHFAHAGPVSFDALNGKATAVVEYLISTGVVDVALFHPYGRTDDVVFHAACNVPALVVASSPHARLCALSALDHHDIGEIAVAFWPKAHRVYFVGFPRMVELLQTPRDALSTELADSFDSMADLVSAVIHMLRDRVRERYDMDIERAHWHRLGSLLFHVLGRDDMDLYMHFLQHTVGNVFWDVADLAQTWFLELVARFGWQQLLPLVLQVVYVTDTSEDAKFMHLLRGLVDENRLRLRQRHATEFLKAVLNLLLRRQNDQGRDWYEKLLPNHDVFLQGALRITSCLATERTDSVVGGVLEQRLPAPIVDIIARFDPHDCSLLKAVHRTELLLQQVPETLWALRNVPLALQLQPYIDIAIAYYATTRDCKTLGLGALLKVSAGTPSFEAAVDAGVRQEMDLNIWVDMLAAPMTHLAPSLAARLTLQVLAAVKEVLPLRVQDAIWICHYVRADDALANLLDRLFTQQAMHMDQVTFIMDVFVPLHDAFVDSDLASLAMDLAMRSVPVLAARLALMSTRETSTMAAWPCDCRTCTKLKTFARDPEPRTEWFVTRGCKYLTQRMEAGTAFHWYPSHAQDLCWELVHKHTPSLVNNPTDLVTKMHDAKARLERSLAVPLQD